MKKIYVLLALLALVVAFSGCSGSESESPQATPVATTPAETQENTDQQSENPYDTATEAVLSGDAKQLDDMIRPILNKIFGGAKPDSYYAGTSSGGVGVTVHYVIKRPVKSEDLNPLKDSIAALGFENNFGGISNGDFGFTFVKDQKETIIIGGSLNEQDIIVTWGKSQ
ncbi:hypothetical protein [Archaeoglobus neptunius]|uniref:hypothetical protein n=1 Tax=Archaeoglobus neptunius TaxID=2798580 RepID=UPI001925C910|nr:hypothetical protein [Archaeoglobus neptunius]